MELNVSVAARDRKLSKSMRSIRVQIEELSESFERVVMLDPLQTSTLILITDDQVEDTIKEIKNNDGVYQVSAGINSKLFGAELKECLRGIFNTTIKMSCFSEPDEQVFLTLIDKW